MHRLRRGSGKQGTEDGGNRLEERETRNQNGQDAGMNGKGINRGRGTGRKGRSMRYSGDEGMNDRKRMQGGGSGMGGLSAANSGTSGRARC